jgi:O-antigen/teichoic acid export membrane protein
MRLPSPGTLHIILAQRLWQAGSGLITIVLVTHFLSPDQQGWYYSLLSIAALYTLFDLGLSYVVMQASAHSFIGLQWGVGGRVSGERAGRFVALTAWSARHYLWLALAFVVIIAPAGFVFFGTTDSHAISWRLPWLVLATATAGTLVLLSFLAIVEGTGKVAEVYTVRLIQGVVAALACWTVLWSGAGLWAVAMAPLCAIAVQGVWIALRKPALLFSAWQTPEAQIDWRKEIWPHQWQIGLGLLSGYLLTQLYTPVLFKAQDAIVAGQMGLTLTAANMLGLVAQSWITRHVPAMARAAAMREWDTLDRMFARDLLLSCLVFVAGGVTLCVLHGLVSRTGFSERLLPFWPFVGVLAAIFAGHIQTCLAAQLRSFRNEPLIWVSLAGAVLTAVGALWGAFHYSATGVVVAMLTIQIVVVLPASVLIWQKCRRTWRSSVGREHAAPDHRDPDPEPVVIPGLGA